MAQPIMRDETTLNLHTRSAEDAVNLALKRIATSARPDLWITLCDESDALVQAAKLDAVPARERKALPLFGLTVAVSDTIDVAGLPTTAACPAFSYAPDTTATAVQRLIDAGAVVLGKTNLDQFNVGLVGSRTPHGPVADAHRRGYAPGGAASGAAIATTLGLVDLAVAVDTLGEARVPAAFAGIAAIKPTRGLVPATGVLPSAASLDTVSVLASDLRTAERALWTMTGPEGSDPQSRAWPTGSPTPARTSPVVAVPDDAQLAELSDEAARAFADAAARLATAGAQLVPVRLDAYREIAELLASGPRVDPERFHSVGDFVDLHPEAVEPYVGSLLRDAGDCSATRYLEALQKGETLRTWALADLGDADALLLPTTTGQPTLDQVITDPRGSDRRLSRYSSFANLLGMAAVAVPSGHADGGRFGVSVFAREFEDRTALDVAARVALSSST